MLLGHGKRWEDLGTTSRRPADRCTMDELADGATLDSQSGRRYLRLWCYRQCVGGTSGGPR